MAAGATHSARSTNSLRSFLTKLRWLRLWCCGRCGWRLLKDPYFSEGSSRNNQAPRSRHRQVTCVPNTPAYPAENHFFRPPSRGSRAEQKLFRIVPRHPQLSYILNTVRLSHEQLIDPFYALETKLGQKKTTNIHCRAESIRGLPARHSRPGEPARRLSRRRERYARQRLLSQDGGICIGFRGAVTSISVWRTQW